MVQTDSHQMGPATGTYSCAGAWEVWEQSPYLIWVPAQDRKQVTGMERDQPWGKGCREVLGL